MGHFFSKVSLFIDKKEAAAHLILDQDFATAPVAGSAKLARIIYSMLTHHENYVEFNADIVA